MRRALVPAVLAALFLAPAAGAWTWPAGGSVLQPFLFDPAHPYAGGAHRGVDVGGEPGSVVVAPASGVVTFAGSVPSSGKSVTIETPDGYSVTLTHLGSIIVTRDTAVAEGATVGTIGPSGDSEIAQPYVHLGVRVTAEAQGYVDPLSLLPVRESAPPPLPAPAQTAPAPQPAAGPAATPDPAPFAPTTPAATSAPGAGSTPVPAAPSDAGAPPGPDVTSAPTIVTASPPTAVVNSGLEPVRTIVARPAAETIRRHLARSPRRPGTAPVAPSVFAPHGSRQSDTRPRTLGSHRSLRESDVHRTAVTVDPAPADRQARSRTLRTEWAPARSGTSLVENTIGFLLALPCALAAAGFTATRRKGAPIIDPDALLRDDTDLLRERQAAHWARVHDDRRRHPRAASPPARRGDLLPHRRRRARDKGLAGR